MATAAIVVNVSMGVMKPVLAKLAKLIGDEYKKLKLKGLRKEVSFLQRELSDMSALLEKMDDADELDPQAKNWRKDIIDMSYDIEDYIDDFMQHVGDADDRVGILQKASHYVRTIKDRHRLANKFQEIKTQVIEASECRKRYMLDQCISDTARATLMEIDPRLSAFYNEAADLVGIDGPKKELIEWVTDGLEQLKVISVVGFGGLGKTTLANEVYREVGGQINYKAFVSVSQKPDIVGLLDKLLSQFRLVRPSHACQLKDLVDIIRDYLSDKRYLIVIDDLWHEQAWDRIKYAFPKNDKKSRVIVTTRQVDVARVCSSQHGSIHTMKPLSDQHSKTLFFKRIFSHEDSCPPQFMGIACEILKKCGGLPLAIITVASILASQPTMMEEQWEHIKNSLGTQSSTISTLQDMRHILDLSYKILPSHLKPCFLYLGAYPEDHEINRDDLVRKWVAEGFVSHTGRNRWDVAQSYFNELVNRSMIQFEERTYVYVSSYKKSHYKVHDMVLDLIVSRCKDNNFLSLVHDPQAIAELQDKVRRLTIPVNGAEDDMTPWLISRKLARLRSLAIFGANRMPSLSNLRFLRVLFLRGFRHAWRIDLTCINQLSQLRYLNVEAWRPNSFAVVVLPNTIRRMRHLETLEIAHFRVRTIPPDIVDLPCLSHLIMRRDTILPTGIGKAKMLHTLSVLALPTGSPEIIKGLGELTNLAKLGVACVSGGGGGRCIPMTTTWMAAWSSSLPKLGNLRHLYVDSHPFSCCADALSLLSRPFPMLEVLDVVGWTFSRVPQWIGDLHKLHTLRFGVNSWDDVGILGKLPCLVELQLRIEGNVPAEGIVIGADTGFGVLVGFYLVIRRTNCLKFEAGAMPNLQKLSLVVQGEGCDNNTTSVGLEHLLNLKEISLSFAMYKGRFPSREAQNKFFMFRMKFRDAVYALPGRPKLDDVSGTSVCGPWEEESGAGSSDPPAPSS